ncbi:MAG: hypothetical protein HQK74_11815 [Desulfamplus sp.]|nr:hypothetical protein [Desulfamplus sp.]
MNSQQLLNLSIYEQELLNITKKMPVDRIVQLIDFARYIQTQSTLASNTLEQETEEAITEDESKWDAQFKATQDGLKKMADKVKREIKAGLARPMIFTKDGRIAKG